MKKHTILFLAANPTETAQLALDREARAIQKELESAGFRDCFELVTRWAVEPLDLLRELRKLKPTVVHFSGHRGQRVPGEQRPGIAPTPRRDIVGDPDVIGSEQGHGLFFQGTDGRAQFVSAHAIEETFGAAGSSVKLVVLNACYSDVQAHALLTHIDCVVGMSGSIRDDAARNFAIGFYGGLGERESITAAYKQGRAAISLEGLPDSERPQLKVRAGIDASMLVLAPDPVEPQASRQPSDSHNDKLDELVAILDNRAEVIVESLIGEYRYIEIRGYIDKFKLLHRDHIEALRGGMLIHAHEILSRIHRLSFELERSEFWARHAIERPDAVYSLGFDAFNHGPVINWYTIGDARGRLPRGITDMGAFDAAAPKSEDDVLKIYRTILDNTL